MTLEPELFKDRARIVWAAVGKERADELCALAFELCKEHDLSPLEIEYLAKS